MTELRRTVWDKPVSQPGMFEEFEHDWRDEWRGMPEYSHEWLAPWNSVLVHFPDATAMRAFAELVEQSVYPTTQSVWYPPAEIGRTATLRYVDEP